MAVFDTATQEVLRRVPKALRSLQEENVKLAAALEEYQRRDDAEEIVAMMDAKGLSDKSVPFKKKVASLLSSEKDFGVVREAISMATPDMSFASLSDNPGSGDEDFEAYILNG